MRKRALKTDLRNPTLSFIQRAQFPYPGTSRSHSCLLGVMHKNSFSACLSGPKASCGTYNRGPQPPTFENSLGIPPGPRKDNGHSNSLCEASQQLPGSTPRERPNTQGRRGRGPAPCTPAASHKKGEELGSGHRRIIAGKGGQKVTCRDSAVTSISMLPRLWESRDSGSEDS